jgi:coproporphyrinogen III oxidase-like Fe-S oxidoreductase
MREFIHNYLTEEGYNNVLSETYSQFDKPSSYHEGRCNHEDIIPVGVASQGSFKDMRTVNPSSIDLWMKNIQQYGVSTQTLQSVGRNGEFLRNMVMFPRYKKISKKYIQSFRDVKDYNRIIKIIKKHIDLSLVEEHENYYSVTDLGVIWYGNLQRDYVNHQLNLKGKVGLNMVSYPKKHFDRKDRIDMNPIAKLFYKVGKDKESGRSLND